MIRILPLIFFFLYSLSASLQAQVRVLEDGAEKLIPESPDSVAILNYYFSQGYLSARVEVASDQSVLIQKGCRFVVKELKFRPVDWEEDPYQVSALSFYSKERVEEVIRRQRESLEDRAYLDTRAEINQFIMDTSACEVSIEVKLFRGSQYHAQEMVYSGNRIHSPSYLNMISAFRDSLLLTKENLKRLRMSLINSA